MSESGLATELADRVRLVVLDVDGVLTDGGVYMGSAEDGGLVEMKRFDIGDGLGIRMLERAGIRVAIVSGRESPATTHRARELGVEAHQSPDGYKMGVVAGLMDRLGCGWEAVAMVGDDLPDLPVLRRVGLPVAVANAVAEVRAVARWRTGREGGRGAVREFAETLLKARGEWSGLVEAYCRERERQEAAP